MDKRVFARWLSAQLRSRDLTQAEFARRLDVSSGTVNRWIHGDEPRKPSPASCDLISDVLGLSIDECLAVAGYRPRMDPIPEGDPRIALHGLIDRIDWALLGPTFVSLAIGTLEHMREQAVKLKREAAEPASR